MQRFATLFVLGLLLASTAIAQPDRVGTDVVWARDIGSATIALDGMLSEPEWAAAETVRVQWNNPLAGPGSGQFFEQNPFGLVNPSDPTDATLSFLRKGNQLYIAAEVDDASVGGSTSLWNFDGLIMSMVNRANRPDDFTGSDDYFGFGAVRAEFFYGWFHPADTTATGDVRPGIRPRGFSNFFGNGFGESQDSTRNTAAWNFATTVDGRSNDDFNGGATPVADNGYVMEMRIALDSLGWDLRQPMARVPLSIAVQDADYNWPQDPNRFIATRTWWQGRWGNNFNEGVAYVAGDPSVTVTSGPAPAYTEAEFSVPDGRNTPEPTIDGVMDEPVWSFVDPQFRIQYQASGDDLDAGLPGVLAPNYTFYFHPDGNPVLDPTVGNISMYYRGSTLYIGLDTDDQAVNGIQGEGGRDGFRLIIRSRDSTQAGVQYTADQLRMDFSIDSLGVIRIENVPEEITNADALQAAVSLKTGSTVADPTDIDAGYQMEVALDLTSIGFGADVSNEFISIALNFFDGDALEDDTQSYSTRTWISGERTNGASILGALNGDMLINTASDRGPVGDGLRALGTAPNPATDRTQVRFALDRTAVVTVEVFDVLGRRVQTVEAGAQTAGDRAVTVDTAGLSAGAYVYRVRLDDGTAVTGRMLVVR